MDSMMAFARAQRAKDDPLRVFNWDKAAEILALRKPEKAEAGLAEDLEWTSGTIWEKGKPVTGEYTFLASLWAIPVLIIDEEEIPCWVYQKDKPEWTSDTKWPESALDTVKRAELTKEE